MASVAPYRLTAAQAAAQIRSGALTVEEYARSILSRIKEREKVGAWAYLDPEYVVKQAKELDEIPAESRGPLHGVAVAVKDVMYTKDMPTEHNSSIYKNSQAGVDAGSVIILRNAGALILGKTTTPEFAAVTDAPRTCNPHDFTRTPGGSSTGSAAAVADYQAAISLGTQTAGSTIRPGSFTGIYALKPTWDSITREGQKIYSLILDTLGLYARSVEDLELLADVFALHDDDAEGPFEIKGAKFGYVKTMQWEGHVQPSTAAAMSRAVDLLKAHGAEVEEIGLPDGLDELPHWHAVVLAGDGRTAFLPEYRAAKDKLHKQLVGHVDNVEVYTHAEYLRAYDSIAAARPRVDAVLSRYAAVLTPSVPGEAPEGIGHTGSPAFNLIWTVSSKFRSLVCISALPGTSLNITFRTGSSCSGRQYSRVWGRKRTACWCFPRSTEIQGPQAAGGLQSSW